MNTQKSSVAVVACLHGNETFGLDVLNAMDMDPQFRDVTKIVANPKAVEINQRTVNVDMNRSFPHPEPAYERAQAERVLGALAGHEFIIDIHTTRTNATGLVVANLGRRTQRIINASQEAHIVHMPPKYSSGSLVGQFDDGAVSLEFSEARAATSETRSSVLDIISDVHHNRIREPKQRYVYAARELIALSVELGEGDHNFNYIPELDGYGFLVGEKAYAATNKGFLLDAPEEMVI